MAGFSPCIKPILSFGKLQNNLSSSSQQQQQYREYRVEDFQERRELSKRERVCLIKGHHT